MVRRFIDPAGDIRIGISRTRQRKMPLMKAILTVAGSDSSGGAGIQADLKTIAANGAYGLCVVTAVTAQNAEAVYASMPVPRDVIAAQFAAVFEAFDIAAVKSGMLVDRERVAAVAAAFRELGAPNYVLDPVIGASSGYPLLERDAVTAMLDDLAPMASLVTPNVFELERMTGRPVRTLEDAEAAAAELVAGGCRAVLVKGGHLPAAPATDLLVTPNMKQAFAAEFLPTAGASGTGCTYSSAIATFLGRGENLIDAVGKAKRYTTAAIRHGPAIGPGAGPMDHLHAMRRENQEN